MRVVARPQTLSACSDLTGADVALMAKQIGETSEDDIERGFVKDLAGYHECKGTTCSIQLIPEKGFLFFHTHPEGSYAEFFSTTDLRNIVVERNSGISCLGFEDENAEPKIKCVRGRDVDAEAVRKAREVEKVLRRMAKEFEKEVPEPSNKESRDYLQQEYVDHVEALEAMEKASKVCSEVLA